MSALKRRVVDHKNSRHWALYGQRGVVDWILRGDRDDPAAYLAVGVHALEPVSDTTELDEDCPVLEGACHVEWSDSGGELVGEEWAAAGFDDEVIWRWLAEYYNERLAGAVS